MDVFSDESQSIIERASSCIMFVIGTESTKNLNFKEKFPNLVS